MPGIYYRDPAQSSPRLLFGPGIRVLSADTLPLDVLPAWKESRRLTLDEGNAAGIASALADYPLMVRLDAANFDFASAAADGRDVRFTRRDGRPIPHEIEAWDAVARKAVLWVKVDSILPGGRTPSFRIHWGNPAASDASDPARVFSDTTWTGVWHSAASSGAPPRLEDASIGANPAFVAGLRSGIAIGETPFGRGLQLLGDTTTLYTLKTFDRPSLFTLSIWFQTDTDSGGRIIGFNRQAARIDTADVRDRHLWMDDAGRLHFGVYESGVPADSARHVLTAPAPLNDGRWHHAAASLSPAGLAFFVDGSKVGEDPTLSIGQVGSGVWRMGFEPGFTDWPDPPSAASFRGALDEARIDRTALSAERIRLDYLSQRPGGGLLKLRVH
jgi:hypothetical protein